MFATSVDFSRPWVSTSLSVCLCVCHELCLCLFGSVWLLSLFFHRLFLVISNAVNDGRWQSPWGGLHSRDKPLARAGPVNQARYRAVDHEEVEGLFVCLFACVCLRAWSLLVALLF